MRARNLKPGFFSNEQLGGCSPWARLLFQGLWCLSDRKGRLQERPKRMKVEIFPYDDVEIVPLLEELASNGLIIRYLVSGINYIEVPGFLNHQTPHVREAESLIPPPPSKSKPRKSTAKVGAGTNLGNQDPNRRSDEHPLNPESGILNPESPMPEFMLAAAPLGAKKAETWASPFYNPFRAAWNAEYAPVDYRDEVRDKDWVQLRSAVNRHNGAFTPENWETALKNYIASPMSKHTMADLASRFPVFLKGPMDRYDKPAKTNEQRIVGAAAPKAGKYDRIGKPG